MALYAAAMGTGLAMPRAAHTLTPGALEAVDAMMRQAHERDVQRTVAKMRTDVGNPRIRLHSGKPPRDLVTLEALAVKRGWKVKRYESPTGHALQGRRGDLGFRATWQWGKTTGASWHEREWRWTLVDDPREVRVDKTAKTGLKKYRGLGLERVHLKLLASPRGIPLNITTLTERIKTS